MQKKIIIREGVEIPDPLNPNLIRKGKCTVTWSNFWVRRKNDGDLEIDKSKPLKSPKINNTKSEAL